MNESQRTPLPGCLFPPGRPPKRQVVWSADQARTFLAVTAETRWAALWRLWLATGARRGELLALEWKRFDSTEGTITLDRTLHRVDYKGIPPLGEPKTAAANRTIVLDPT